MVEAIGHALSGFDAATRRFLLTIKRSCFNGREIGRYRGKAEWAELLRVSPGLAERIPTLEERLLEHDRSFAALYESELTRERRHVLTLAEDRHFLRGVALGRPGLVEKIRARAPSLKNQASLKRQEKWEQSLLRFVTRTVAKFSANSTLTAYALGNIDASPSAHGFHFVDSPLREISLVRANRPEIEQFQALLLRHPMVRERSFVAWNDSFEKTEPGRCRFLRGGYWNLEPGAERFHFTPQARIKMTLSSALLGNARNLLREGPVRYNRLLVLLEDEHGIAAGETSDLQPRSTLDRLIDIGLLILMPPWLAYESRLEQRIGSFLHSLPDDPSLRTIVEALDELLALEEGFASALQSESAIFGMKDALSRLIGTTLHLANHKGPLITQANFFEDVLLEPIVTAVDDPVIFQIAAPIVEEILQVADMVGRFASLFNHRHDVLHTLAAWWREHEPHRREAPFVEIAQEFAPVWKKFVPFHETAEESALSTFDPLQAAALETLREMRRTLFSSYEALLGTAPTRDFLPVSQFSELVGALPQRYAPLLGASVFVQPLDASGDSWVVNNLYEGTGRYLSRVTPVMEEPLRQRFLDYLAARSVVVLDGEEADLLEIKYPWGNLVRAHPPQTAKVLELRGLYLDLPRERRVSLSDLTIQADLDAETFRVVDASGRRVLPVYLSTLSNATLPNLLRLLLAFGPGEIRSVFPSGYSEGDQDFKSITRLTCGRLVVRRRTWMFGIESLRKDLESLSDTRAHAAIHDWRLRLGLPVTGFYYERVRHGHPGQIKPQYVDFGSPSLCGLFVSSLRKMTTQRMMLEEALPSPADFPFGLATERRGFELLIDNLAVRDSGGNLSTGTRRHDREITSLRKERQHG